MKTLELENYGVQEMSIQEMKEVDGGFPLIIFFMVAAFIGYKAGIAIGEVIFNKK